MPEPAGGIVADEIASMFGRYEAALVANDVEALDRYFWDDPRVVRFGPDGTERGWAELAARRRLRPYQALPRTLRDTVIVTFGADTAVVSTEFVVTATGEVGRQSQTWRRFAEGWRIVAAHVSPAPTDGGKGADQHS